MQTAEIQRTREIGDDGWWHRARRSLLAREVRRVGRPGRAVDISAAGGGDTRVLVEHGWLATAVDTSDAAIDLARSRGLDTHRADPTRLLLPSQSYDLALAVDVFQFLDEDNAAATEMARVLRPGATALVCVPADPRLWSGEDIVAGHVRRYTRRALGELLEAAGFTIDRMWSWDVLLRGIRSTRCQNDRGELRSGLCRTVLRAERFLPVAGLPGTTLIARAHRS